MVGSQEERQGQVQQLQVEVDHLETKLQEASKVREARLRKAGPPGRARMASELREMDQDILVLTRALAVRPRQSSCRPALLHSLLCIQTCSHGRSMAV